MVILLAVLLGCEPAPACPDGAMADGDGGLVVTEAEHPTGWGDAACFECHAVATLHRSGCTPWVDPEALQQQVDDAVATQGAAACVGCHGDNGVEP